MDVSKLLDFVPKNLKMLILPFIVCLPMAYTGGILTINSYLQYSIFTQTAIAMAITMAAMVIFATTTHIALKNTILGANATMVYFAGWLMMFAVNENDNSRVNWFFCGIFILLISISIIGRFRREQTAAKEPKQNKGGDHPH